MADPRQGNPLSFNGFTFNDETDDHEITGVKFWLNNPPADPNTSPSQLPVTVVPDADGWNWNPMVPPDPNPPTGIVCVYFVFQGPNGWSPLANATLAENITSIDIKASSGASAGVYNIYSSLWTIAWQTVTIPPPPP